MISISEAIALVLDAVRPMPAEEVGLGEAWGRVLAADVAAGFPVPPFANSQMDGYAVRSADVAGARPEAPARLAVLGTIAAGRVAEAPVRPGSALKIMTGAPMPEGADAVVRVEDTRADGAEVLILEPAAAGHFVRAAGEDVGAGETVLAAGRLLRAADVGILASLGRPSVAVRSRPRVAILATGDELVALGAALRPGQIYNSNAYALAAAVLETGGEPSILGIVPDDRDSLRAAFAAAARCDAVLSTGGVSVGDFDHVKEIMDELGLERRFWQVAQKPGKPITFAARDGRLYFGLPGNPVSSLVCFALYVAPALRRALGLGEVFAPTARVALRGAVRTARDLTELVRCTLHREGDRLFAEATGSQSSGVLRSLSLADCLVISPPGTGELRRGDEATALLLAPDRPLSSVHPFA